MNEYIYLYEDEYGNDTYKIIKASNVMSSVIAFYEYCGGRLDKECFSAIANNCILDDVINKAFDVLTDVVIHQIITMGDCLYSEEGI